MDVLQIQNSLHKRHTQIIKPVIIFIDFLIQPIIIFILENNTVPYVHEIYIYNHPNNSSKSLTIQQNVCLRVIFKR